MMAGRQIQEYRVVLLRAGNLLVVGKTYRRCERRFPEQVGHC